MTVHRRLDQILQAKGQVSERQIREALIKQSVLGGSLGEYLIKRGGISEAELVDALSEQSGLPGVCLERRAIEPSLFDRLPFTLAERCRCVPFAYNASDDKLDVAFANPNDRTALRAVSAAVHPTRVVPYVGAAVHIRAVLTTGRQTSESEPGSAVSLATIVNEADERVDRLLDLLELAVSSSQGTRPHGMSGSAWVSSLAVDIAERLMVSREELQVIRLAALTSDIADWRHGPSDRPRSETLARAIVVLSGLELPWDVVSVLQGCAKGQTRGGCESLPSAILRTAWAVADAMPESDDDDHFDGWHARVRDIYGDGLDEKIVATALVVLRVRSLRQRLGDYPPEIVVIGTGTFTDDLIGLLQETHYRVVRAQYWAEGIVLLERRRPDLVCIIASGIRIPPQLVMEAQMAEHGIDLRSVVMIVPSGRTDFPYQAVAGESAILLGDSAGVHGALGCIHEVIQSSVMSPATPCAGSGQGLKPGPAVAGRLADLGLPDLVQILSSAHKTARVTLSCAHGEGSLWFDRGQIACARSERRSGDEAFFDLLGWTDGRFEVHTVDRVPTRNITAQTTALLLEGFRRMDESTRALHP
jgi:hypothetical protein